MSAEVVCGFEDDLTFSVCMNESFADAVNRDWWCKFFEGVEILFISRHVVGAAGVVYPDVVVSGSSEGLRCDVRTMVRK